MSALEPLTTEQPKEQNLPMMSFGFLFSMTRHFIRGITDLKINHSKYTLLGLLM